jgi:hypothetical protein
LGRTGAHRRPRASALAPLCVAAIAVAGCGSGERQDEDEPKGQFPVDVVSASFPKQQKLAKNSKMSVVVRNAGQKTIPQISVTVKCPGQRSGSGGSSSTTSSSGFDYRSTFRGVGDPARPQFALNTIPTRTPRNYDRGRLDPLERSSAYVNTYPLGKLAPGRTVTFIWDVTAVKAGPYHICYRVNAGLDGKAKAVPSQGGGPIAGEFRGTVSDVAPQARIAEDGHTVVEEEARAGE